MSYIIEPRAGVEVYVSNAGCICIKQEDPDYASGESCIILDPSLVPRVVEFLQCALDDYLASVVDAKAREDESAE